MTDDLVKRLRSPANVFYEYAADNGAFLREAASRIEKLEAALRFIAGPSTVEFVDGTYEISETKMLSTYRRRAKRALEGNYDD
jgi:hypothetical protein